jgi:TatD DNase family protein
VAWFDSHCHVSSGGEEPPGGWPSLGPEAVADARRAGVAALVTVGTDATQSRAALNVAQSHQGVWATVGLHPHDASQGVATIVPLLGEAGVVAVGECGLDYHYDHSPRLAQRQAFAAQVALAHERGLALVIHTREAWEDTFSVLRDEGLPERTVFHCFTGGPDEARRCLDLGAYLSFSGIVTFSSAHEVRAAACLCPLERLMVETDAPYLAPVPYRGKPNRPALVPLVGAAIASARGGDVGQVEEATWLAAHRAFGLPSPSTAP